MEACLVCRGPSGNSYIAGPSLDASIEKVSTTRVLISTQTLASLTQRPTYQEPNGIRNTGGKYYPQSAMRSHSVCLPGCSEVQLHIPQTLA